MTTHSATFEETDARLYAAVTGLYARHSRASTIEAAAAEADMTLEDALDAAERLCGKHTVRVFRPLAVNTLPPLHIEPARRA